MVIRKTLTQCHSPMTDIFIRNLREVCESALNSCGYAADGERHYTEEREQAPSRGQKWTQAAI